MNDRATNPYQSLHDLTAAQAMAVDALSGGATHAVAAEAAGVNRVTVSRWSRHHPQFVAEVNRRREVAASDAATKVRCMTDAALLVVERAIDDGDVDAAFRWLRVAGVSTVTEPPEGPNSSDAVIERVRRTTPTDLDRLLLDSPGSASTEEACAVIRRQLADPEQGENE